MYVPASYRACDHVLKTSLFSQCVHPGHMHVRVLHFHVCTYVLYTLFTCSVVESKTGQFHCSLNANTSYRGFSNIHAVCTYAHQRKHTLQTLVGETYTCLLCDISRKHAIEMRACTDTQVFTESGCAILCTLRCVLWLRIKGRDACVYGPCWCDSSVARDLKKHSVLPGDGHVDCYLGCGAWQTVIHRLHSSLASL